MPSELNYHLNWAHSLVYDWFINKFGTPTEPQIEGWPSILAGKSTLISAPTGSGKTFAAFLACLEQLVQKAIEGNLIDRTEVLYVSPLKALSYDIHKNLTEPLNEIMQLAQTRGITMQEITVAVRTGDTLPRDRQAMLKKPPHILVTTPESLYILLTAQKSRLALKEIKTVIVDEIHSLADDKRGSHLALSLERLEALCEVSPVRIGLSATQKPIEVVADFLAGNGRKRPIIVNIGHKKQVDLAVEVPNSELGSVASNSIWDEVYDKLAQLANENRSTLIFVNTRRLAERIAHHLSERLGKEVVAAHHGSLSRKLRHAAETKLKDGQLKALVATASLELGIDIGSIDLVCQIGSPRSIAIALQRVGRAGHWRGAISKGRFFATTRDELLECAALIRAIHQGQLDQLLIPNTPIDILCQQIVAACSTNDWTEDELFRLIKQAYPYRHLTQAEYYQILEILSEGIAGTRGKYGTYLFWDKVNQIVKGRRGSRLAAITNGGAIPENGLFSIICEPDGTFVGTVDEDFAVESSRGDIILLGTSSWKVKRVESTSGKLLVEDAHGAPPSVPFWRGEAPDRTQELSFEVANLRNTIDKMLPMCKPAVVELTQQQGIDKCLQWLLDQCGLERMAGEQLIEYILQGRAVLGTVPTQNTIIAERFFDEAGSMQLIIHSPFGAKINKAWGLALRKRFCRSFNFELQAAATDNGINISLAEQHSFPLIDVFNFLHPNSLTKVLTQAVLQSPVFTTRWRWTATRSLALLRFRNGKKLPPHIQRILSDDLLAAVFPDAAACQDNLAGKDIELPDHPLINETMKEVLYQALDLDGLQNLIQKIVHGEITCLAVDTPLPSVFSHEILNANPYAFLDDAPLEERRARAVEMRRLLPDSVLEEVGRLDPEAIEEVQNQAWPDIRNPDDLHDFLQAVINLPEEIGLSPQQVFDENWLPFLKQLVASGRIASASLQGRTVWLAAEKKKTFLTLYPEAVLLHEVKDIFQQNLEREAAIVKLLQGWLLHLGPVTNRELCQLLNLSEQETNQALITLEASGFILRGKFRQQQELEWCERRLLARIHRYTLGKLRAEIEPVTAAQYMRWLLKWHHLIPHAQVRGEQGLIEVIRQLQGYEAPANAWERQIFAKRVIDYDSTLLDKLCLMGIVSWGRISNHPTQKLIKPTSVAPITFFLRQESEWMPEKEIIDTGCLSHIANSIYLFLKERGASFFDDIARGIGHLKTEVENGLWELVSVGLITADAFDNLRGLINPKRRLNKNRRRSARFSSGRWCLLSSQMERSAEQKIEAACWMLLKRYGIVFRDLILKEKNIPRWRDLLVIFRRLEARGEIRGGRFVYGFLGEQFALPYAIDSLRAIKKQKPSEEKIILSATDPLNLIGLILPGKKIPSLSVNKITLEM